MLRVSSREEAANGVGEGVDRKGVALVVKKVKNKKKSSDASSPFTKYDPYLRASLKNAKTRLIFIS